MDLDGTLYHPLPVKLVMGLELALLGARAWSAVAAFRREHESLREAPPGPEEVQAAGGPYQLQLARAAQSCGLEPGELGPLVEHWMVRRPARWLRLFRRRSLISQIDAFLAQGGRCALVSDYPARFKLQAMGLETRFEVVVANGEEGGPPALKPAPQGYLEAARRLGVAPEEALVIGDRDEADGAAARAAGMSFRLI